MTTRLRQPIRSYAQRSALINAVVARTLAMEVLSLRALTASTKEEVASLKRGLRKGTAHALKSAPPDRAVALYQTYDATLSQNDHDFVQSLLTKSVAEAYDSFELFLADTFSSVLFCFPGLVCNIKHSLGTDYKILWTYKTLKEIREASVERYVHDIMYSSDVNSVIATLAKLTSCTFAVPDELSKRLFELSKIRNIIVHNSGIVNRQFLAQLRSRGIKTTPYKLGKFVYHTNSDHDLNDLFLAVQTSLSAAVNVVAAAVWDDRKRLRTYSQSLAGDNFV